MRALYAQRKKQSNRWIGTRMEKQASASPAIRGMWRH